LKQTLPYEKHTKMLMGMKRYREARLVCLKWVEAEPDNAHAWTLKAIAETNAHQPNAALDSIDRGLALQPEQSLMLAQRAQILGIIGHSGECLAILANLLGRPDLPAPLLHQIGTIYNNVGEHDKAVTLFEHIREQDPGNAVNLSSLATAYHILGRSVEAAAVQREAIEIAPDDFRAYWLLGQMNKATREDNLVSYFTDSLSGNEDKLQARICLNFALAKQHEEIEEFDQAFGHLQKGSAAVLEHTAYDIEPERQHHRSIMRSFTPESLAAMSPGCASKEPIFILGMPRTGTTLLEQIITTYEGIETAGELHHFPHLVNQSLVKLNPDATRDTVFERAGELDWKTLGESYLAAARLHVGESPRFIDKYPLNFTLAGPILTAFPRARIINLTRNPMDTCFSNYKLLFRLGTALHSYDLQTMGEYYCLYREMMLHWHSCLPGKILDVSYESLVTQAEQETRRVCEFLELDWQPACLEFYKSGGAVATASTTQVRKPINTGSLQKWRKFERHLQPLAEFFEARGIEIDR
jgi:tetratricopeptide (TPR) repeat protein